jgi:hypothetical protein
MSVILDALQERGYTDIDEAMIADWVGSHLPPRSALTADPVVERFMAEHAGIGRSAAPAELRAALAGHAVAELADTLSTAGVVDLLGVDRTRVQHMLRSGQLFAFKTSRQNRFPNWQFTDSGVVPGLDLVLRSLPADLDPIEVHGFMTAPQADLNVSGEPATPVEWLTDGGPAARVVELAGQLDRPWL